MSESHDQLHDKVAGLYNRASQSSLRFLVPGAAMVAVVLFVVNGYTPLQFQEPQAQANTSSENLDGKVDASKLEKKTSKKVKSGKKVSANDLKDGTYTGYSRCTENGVFDYYLALDVTIKGGKVVKISNVRGTNKGRAGSEQLDAYDSRNVKYLNWAVSGRNGTEGVVKQIMAVAKKGSVASSIDTVSGATYSSQSILEAYQDALSQASRSGKSLVTAKTASASANASTGSSKSVSSSSGISANATFKDGTYTGYSRCTESGVFDYYVALDVTIKDGKVTRVSNVHGSATGGSGSKKLSGYDSQNNTYLSWAKNGRNGTSGVVSQIMAAAKKGGVASSIDTVSGATYSSQSILEAYQNALSKAAVSGKGSTSVSTKAKAKTTAKKAKRKAATSKSGIGKNTKLADGTFTGYDRCTEEDTFDYYVALKVTVKNGKVTKVANVHGSATGDTGSKKLSGYDSVNDTYLSWATNGRNGQTGVVKQIMAVAKKGSVASSVDAVTGATYSSESILRAYQNALQKSAKKAGSSTTVPSNKNGNNGTNNNSGKTDDNGKGKADDTPTVKIKQANSGLTDGTYTGYALAGDADDDDLDFTPYYIGVTVTVADGKIADVTTDNVVPQTSVDAVSLADPAGVINPAYRYDASQNAYYFKRALNGFGISGKHPGLVKQINTGLAAGAALTDYDTISGATYSSEAIINAYTAAVAKATPRAADDDAADTADSASNGAAGVAVSASDAAAALVAATVAGAGE